MRQVTRRNDRISRALGGRGLGFRDPAGSAIQRFARRRGCSRGWKDTECRKWHRRYSHWANSRWGACLSNRMVGGMMAAWPIYPTDTGHTSSSFSSSSSAASSSHAPLSLARSIVAVGCSGVVGPSEPLEPCASTSSTSSQRGHVSFSRRQIHQTQLVPLPSCRPPAPS